MVVLSSLVLVVAAGCTRVKPAAAPPTTLRASTTVPTTTTSTTAGPTTTGVPLTTVTTLVTVGPGEASIGGTVSGPSGPVEGATVRVERRVGPSVASADVTSAAGGAWQMASVLGGSYRVWAFKSPDLAQSQVEAFFLAANERRTVDFKLNAVGGERITSMVRPDPPRVGQLATLVVTVATGRVDDQGRASIAPRSGLALTLVPEAGIVLQSAPQAVTDANGSATWGIRCAAQGADSAWLRVGTGVTPVTFTPCEPPGATITTGPVGTTVTTGPG